MKLNNPFVISGYRGPEYFCDRVEETKRLCTLVRNESSVRVSLETLVDAELVYPGPDGYCVYDRLMGEYLKR